MADHQVSISTKDGESTMSFPATFNVAVPFIDRHLDEGRADKVAIRTVDGETVTYGQLAERVYRAGNALLGLGIEPGERVLMIVKDCPAFFYVFWGAIKAGVVPVPLNTLLVRGDYQYMIEDSECAALIYSPEFAGEAEPAVEAANHRPRHVLRAEGEGRTFVELMDGAPATLDPAEAGPTDDCFWLYSSGSTGRPKGAVHAQRDMVVTSQNYGVDAIGLSEDDVSFSAAKLFFAYGLGNAMTFPLWTGGTAILDARRPTPDMTFEVIETFKPTYYYGVPTLYAAQLQAIDNAKPDLSSLAFCCSAGEALPPEILRRWQEKVGVPICEGIGTTEMLHIFIASTPNAIKPGYTGKLVPGYRARILGEDGEDAKPGEAGALIVHGLSAAKYYWNKPEKTAETMLGDDWLRTGDTYVMDEDGFFQCHGRSDDMLKVGGIWVSPVEIESRLVEHPRVLEAAVVGRADDDELVKPEAWIILKDGANGDEALERELLEHCKEGLARYKYPRWFHFVDELPKTATGKIQRFKLRA